MIRMLSDSSVKATGMIGKIKSSKLSAATITTLKDSAKALEQERSEVKSILANKKASIGDIKRYLSKAAKAVKDPTTNYYKLLQLQQTTTNNYKLLQLQQTTSNNNKQLSAFTATYAINCPCCWGPRWSHRTTSSTRHRSRRSSSQQWR